MEPLLDELARLSRSDTVHMVVTCNVDHSLLLAEDARLRNAYDHASIRTIDGAPVAGVVSMLQRRRAHRCTGSDILANGCSSPAWANLRVAVVGSGDVVERAVHRLQPSSPAALVPVAFPRVGTPVAEEPTEVLKKLRETRPDIVFICLGSPKQEVWLDMNRAALPPGVYVCAGAAADFAAGTQRRAPRLVRAAGMEWVFRLLREPRRLYHRYLVRGPRFLLILLRTARRK